MRVRRLKHSVLLLLITFLVSLCFLKLQSVSAAGTSFTMGINQPTNQIEKNTNYFNLLVKPKQEQTLTIVLKNLVNKPNTITVTPVSAYTNNNGIIDYKTSITSTKTAAKYQWSDLVSPNSMTIEVPANSTRNINFTLKVPNDTFPGLIDGGFRAMSTSDAVTTQAKQGLSIKNKYAMIIGATVQMSKEYVSPELELNEIQPALVANTTTLLANIENTKPSLFGKMTIDAKVTKRGSDKVLHSAKRTNLSMAPLSNFNYQVDWGREQFKNGKYTLYLTAKSGSKTWKFTRNFTIAAASAEKVNKKAVNLKKPNYWWIWLLLGLLVLILIILLIIWKRRKKDDDDEPKAEESKPALKETKDTPDSDKNSEPTDN